MQAGRRQTLVSALAELLSYPDDAFVKCAYLMILGRQAEPAGLRHYLGELGAGSSRISVLVRLAHSHEARTRGISRIEYDLALAGAWLAGWLGARPVPADFDPVVYLLESPDVLMDRRSAYHHFLHEGQREGRATGFDADWYAEEYRGLIPAGLSPRDHYERFGRAQRRYPRFDAAWYLARYPDVGRSGRGALEHYRTIGRREGRAPAYSFRVDYPNWIRRFDSTGARRHARSASDPGSRRSQPVISILMGVSGGDHPLLAATLRSVLTQTYPQWELCIAMALDAPAAAREIITQCVAGDARARLEDHPAAQDLAGLRNAALASATGDWVTVLESGDEFAADALDCLAGVIVGQPDMEIVYSDEDCINPAGRRLNPYFKCDWNPELFLSHDLIGHLAAYRRELVLRAGGFLPDAAGAEDYDLALRCTAQVDARHIHHVPWVLYHRRVPSGDAPGPWGERYPTPPGGIVALSAHLHRLGSAAVVEPGEEGYRVRYRLPARPPLVSLIIPTRNGLALLRQCLTSILTRTDYPVYEILVIDNGSDDPGTLEYLRQVAGDARVRVIRDPRPFNYSALNNAAARLARGELLALVNNDIEVITPGWLTEMVSHALRPEIGAVGAKLWYPNDTLQHGGVILGRGGAWHAHSGITRDDPGYMGRAVRVQALSAVTGACLVVRKSVYERLGGLNEVDLTVAYNDVDFCLRAVESGYRNVWTPFAQLYHHESATRGTDDTEEKARRARRELDYMQQRWGQLMWEDPAYSPNLSGEFDDFSLAWPPRGH